MSKKECIAMLLAGGQGNRLGLLTKNLAKPAVPFGGKYRIIDFTLSNCTNSGIDTVGVLTQYRPLRLNSYIGNGQPWDLDRLDGGVYVLPPYMKGKVGEWYKGTANAICQNIEFIEQFNPTYILVLSGDHIYKMDYGMMIEYHKEKRADATIAVIEVKLEDADRFGIMNTDDNERILEFEEKPKFPKSNKASMGIYVFNWKVLKHYLMADDKNTKSDHDFGKNIIPAMLNDGRVIYAYKFKGYWKDVGTIQSLYQSNMDLLEFPPVFDLYSPSWKIYGRNQGLPPHYVAPSADVKKSIISEGSIVYGKVWHSIISSGVIIDEGATIKDSIIMPYTRIGKDTLVEGSIIAERVSIGNNCTIGRKTEGKSRAGDLTLIGENSNIPDGTVIERGMEIDSTMLQSVIDLYESNKKEVKAL